MKEVSIDELSVGDIVRIEGTPRTMSDNEITYIGNGVGAYKDRYGIEFTFATNSVTFYIDK